MKRLLILLLTLLAVACSSSAADRQAPSSPPPSSGSANPSRPLDPTRLVGLWSVRDTKPALGDLAVTLGETLTVWQRCGELSGTWTADQAGAFLAETDGGSMGCFSRSAGFRGASTWLTPATSFLLAGSQVLLFDAGHHRLARLVRRASLRPGSDIDPAAAVPPTIDNAIKARLAPAQLPPAGDRPVTAAALYGRWLPVPVRHYLAGQPHLVFQRDGVVGGSDGCNGQGGRWLLSGPASATSLLTLTGPSTLIGCPGVAVGSWLFRARSLRFHGTELVLYDRDARPIGALVRPK